MTEDQYRIVIGGAGYAGLHVALRLGTWLERHPQVQVTLVDRHDYHQVLTELPRVASGARASDAVRVPVDSVLSPRVRFLRAEIAGFDLPGQSLRTAAGDLPYTRLVLALGSRPNDFAIPGLAEHVLLMWSADDADRIWRAVNLTVEAAARSADEAERRRLLTVVIGGGGATGVELAGALAEELPALARKHGLPEESTGVILIEAGHTILAGSSPGLIARAEELLARLGVEVRTNAAIASASTGSVTLKGGTTVRGGVFIWAGGVKAPELVAGSGLPVGYNGRVKVDRYLRALDHSEIFVAGDLASVIDPETGHALPPLAQTALAEGDTVAHNLRAEVDGTDLEAFDYRSKGIVVSVGAHRGVADIIGRTVSGRLAAALKDAIEWEYRQSVQHLRGWSPV